MCVNIKSMLKTKAAQLNLYKIESFNNECAEKIARHIRNQKGKCSVLGSAVVTNHTFNNANCAHLVGRTRSYEELTQFDIESFLHI